jgi:NAD-dependent dihydropyrimidine dehydrogenase PreA subunit
MSKTWYPVLNYEKCIECGACSNKCSHGVLKLEDSRPVVVNPTECVEGCHGCGNLCPSGAIDYVGNIQNGSCNCSGDCIAKMENLF